MCGIAGIYGRVEGAQRRLQRMVDAQVHRGPDDQGFHLDDACILGVRRLSIIDVAGGHQPIYDETSRHVIVFNGEVYNFADLRSDLEAAGHRFGTHSDTEAVLHAYEAWGPRCLDRLRGMFALAIWDRQERRLFLARDRMGIKPLYLYQQPGLLVFGSEVRALLASGLVPRTLSPEGVASYLAFGSVQEPLTLVEGVRSLPPGHFMLIDEHGARLEEYWDVPGPAEAAGGAPDGAEAVWEVRRLLEEAVELRLISEVPLGAFLSSGIDSGAVVALMSGVSRSPVRTFTIGFSEEEFDESRLARRMAERYATDHHEILVSPGQVLEDLPQALRAMDQPSIDGINTYYVSRAARQAGITVALSGLGGDEVFGGYHSFRLVPRLATWGRVLERLPGPARELAAAPIRSWPATDDRGQKLADYVAGRRYDSHPYFAARSLFPPTDQVGLLASPDRVGNPWRARMELLAGRAAPRGRFGGVSYLESKTYLASTLLRDTDAMSMAHSLEVRVPLIDHRVVEYVNRLPDALRQPGSRLKRLLVEAMGDDLLPEVVEQPKRTFTFPWAQWLRGELRGEIEASLARWNGALGEVVPASGALAVWRRFLEGRTSWSRAWSMYVLSTWCDLNLGAS